MSREKAQGTAWESELVRRAKARRLSSRRLAEGGALDEGDVEVVAGELRVIIEGKARAQLGVHQALAKAQQKAGDAPAVVAWKRLVKRNGQARRVTTGVRDLVVVDIEFFFELLAKAGGVPDDDPQEPTTNADS